MAASGAGDGERVKTGVIYGKGASTFFFPPAAGSSDRGTSRSRHPKQLDFISSKSPVVSSSGGLIVFLTTGNWLSFSVWNPASRTMSGPIPFPVPPPHDEAMHEWPTALLVLGRPTGNVPVPSYRLIVVQPKTSGGRRTNVFHVFSSSTRLWSRGPTRTDLGHLVSSSGVSSGQAIIWRTEEGPVVSCDSSVQEIVKIPPPEVVVSGGGGEMHWEVGVSSAGTHLYACVVRPTILQLLMWDAKASRWWKKRQLPLADSISGISLAFPIPVSCVGADMPLLHSRDQLPRPVSFVCGGPQEQHEVILLDAGRLLLVWWGRDATAPPKAMQVADKVKEAKYIFPFLGY